MIHLLGPELVPPCIDPTLNPEARGKTPEGYVDGPWSPVLNDVTCPDCQEWVHA